MQNQNKSFSELTLFLKNLQNGLKNFDLSDIHDLLWGRNDKEFIEKAGKRWSLMNSAIAEIQEHCAGHPPIGQQHIRFLLWQEISEKARQKARLDTKAEDIGNALISALKKPGDEQLICIPLIGSVSPRRKEPSMYTLADGVWLIEAADPPNRLIPRLYELAGGLPAAIIKILNSIGDLRSGDPFRSEYAPLLFAPLIACQTKGSFSDRASLLRRFGIPLIALHNLARVNRLCLSDTPLVWTRLSEEMFFSLPKEVQEEWNAQIGSDLLSWAVSCGLPSYFPSTGFLAEDFRQVFSYNIEIRNKRIVKVISGERFLPLSPPILILPSLLDLTATKKLIEAGERMKDPTISDLHRRIGHAARMWTPNCGRLSN